LYNGPTYALSAVRASGKWLAAMQVRVALERSRSQGSAQYGRQPSSIHHQCRG